MMMIDMKMMIHKKKVENMKINDDMMIEISRDEMMK
jgi:hypothetical protein